MQSVFYPPGGNFLLNFGAVDTPLNIIGPSSYRFFLFPNIWAFGLALLIVAFQAALFYILWKDTKDLKTQEFESSMDRWIGIMCACFVLALKLLPEFGKGMELLWFGMRDLCRSSATTKRTEYNSLQLVLLLAVGFVIFGVAALCVWVGITSSLKQGSVSAIITRATIATWIEGMDEHMFSFLKHFSDPTWYSYATDWLEQKYGENKPELGADEISALKEMLKKKRK